MPIALLVRVRRGQRRCWLAIGGRFLRGARCSSVLDVDVPVEALGCRVCGAASRRRRRSMSSTTATTTTSASPASSSAPPRRELGARRTCRPASAPRLRPSRRALAAGRRRDRGQLAGASGASSAASACAQARAGPSCQVRARAQALGHAGAGRAGSRRPARAARRQLAAWRGASSASAACARSCTALSGCRAAPRPRRSSCAGAAAGTAPRAGREGARRSLLMVAVLSAGCRGAAHAAEPQGP